MGMMQLRPLFKQSSFAAITTAVKLAKPNFAHLPFVRAHDLVYFSCLPELMPTAWTGVIVLASASSINREMRPERADKIVRESKRI
jgi:hypothetical protein